MGDLRATTLTGRETTLPAAAVDAFTQSLRGELILPGDATYAEARQVWNANIDRRPSLICRPLGVADVLNAVTFARDHHLLVSVRGGAHSFPGTCVCDGGLVIDLSLMKGIRVDPVRCTPMATTSLTSVGSDAGSSEPIRRPSPAMGHEAEILDVSDPDLGYDAEKFPYQPPQRTRRSTSHAGLLGG